MITQLYGDLELGFTKDLFEVMGAKELPLGADFYRAVPPKGWWVLGTYCMPNRTKIYNQRGALIVKSALGADLLKPPIDYQEIWHIDYQGEFGKTRWSMWRPVSPEGYVALGDVFASGKPKEDRAIACVKKTHRGHDYVRRGETGKLPVWLHSSSEFGTASGWSIEAPPYPYEDTEEHLFVPAGMFTAVTSGDRPAPTDVTWVLDLPAVVEKGSEPEVPTLHSYDRPPRQTVMVTDRVVTVPYFMVKDDKYDETWRIDNSPFYKIQRNRYYELILFRDNKQGSEPQTDSEEIEHGISIEQSRSFTQTTGITTGVTVGVEVSAAPFGVGVTGSVEATINLSWELGYERRYGITMMESRRITHALTTPARSSCALWVEDDELLPIRGDGSLVSAGLDFRTLYYHTSQYPPAREGGDQVGYTELDTSGQPLPTTMGIAVQASKEAKPDETVTE